MKNFEFNGEWERKIRLNNFNLRSKFKDAYLYIQDSPGDNDPDPSIEQLNTINFLFKESNQLEIINSIIIYLNETIYPYYQKNKFALEDYPNNYPDLKSTNDFYIYFRLMAVEIYTQVNQEYTYHSLIFNVDLLDREHGLSIDMHKTRCLDHGPAEGTDKKKLFAESKTLPNKTTIRYTEEDYKKAIIYKPHPKYNKLKPWQQYANSRFPINAYNHNEDDLIINSIKDGTFEPSKFKWIYDYAKRDNRLKLVKYFETLEYFKEK